MAPLTTGTISVNDQTNGSMWSDEEERVDDRTASAVSLMALKKREPILPRTCLHITCHLIIHYSVNQSINQSIIIYWYMAAKSWI